MTLPRQRTPEWREWRRTVVTATDLGPLLGVDDYRCEADVADEKLNGSAQDENVRMRIGSALEPLILEEYERATGRRAVRLPTPKVHPTIPWAAASCDARVIGERRLVECKWTARPSRFADGLPEAIEAQVAWQLGVTGYPVADVVVLTPQGMLDPFEVTADPAMFEELVRIAADFRRRLAEGGPFARNDERIRRDYPADNGVLLPATPDLVALAQELADARAAKAEADKHEKTVASALRAILLDASGVEGVLTYRKSADTTRVNWPAVALAYRDLLTDRSAAELDAVIAEHSETKSGPRVLRLSNGDD